MSMVLQEKHSLEDFQEIINLFDEDSGSITDVTRCFGNLFISGEGNELKVKFDKPRKSITISQIMFQNRRIGNGFKLLSWLKEYAKIEGYSYIFIVNGYSKEIENFALKHNFSKEGQYGEQYRLVVS